LSIRYDWIASQRSQLQMNYLYDQSFEGLLTCVYHHWYTEKADGIFSEGMYQLDLSRYAMTVETDGEKASRVLNAVTEKLSIWDAKRVYQTFCSCVPEKEMKILRYIAYGFEKGPKIRLLHGDPIVKAVEEAEGKVGLEVHRYCGLIRFSETYDQEKNAFVLYSKIEPDNDVLEFLAPHFSDRFKSEPFIIHDLKRGKALLALERKWEIVSLTADESEGLLNKTECEHDYAALWKQYFDVMATRERINPKCQKNFMPVRYWKHLTEANV
jgi:probable DNA metabolism protein